MGTDLRPHIPLWSGPRTPRRSTGRRRRRWGFLVFRCCVRYAGEMPLQRAGMSHEQRTPGGIDVVHLFEDVLHPAEDLWEVRILRGGRVCHRGRHHVRGEESSPQRDRDRRPLRQCHAERLHDLFIRIAPVLNFPKRCIFNAW